MFRRALSLDQTPDYLQPTDNPNAVNLCGLRSVALGRRFRALKLWFVLRYYGREGIAGLLRGHIRDGSPNSPESHYRRSLALELVRAGGCFTGLLSGMRGS